MDFVFIDVAEETTDVVSALQHMHRNQPHTEEFKFISRDGQHEFTSHLLILAIHSSVLQDMIYGPSSCRSIKIEHVDNLAIENLIRHCYAEKLVFASVNDVTETKILADKFQILELGRICVTRLASIDVNLSNVIFVLKTSIEFNDAIKESECLLLIKENKEAVFTSEPFQAIKFENVLEIFVKLRERDFLTEFEFLHSGIRWLLTNGNQNEGKEILMNRIDISKISLNGYLDVIVSYPGFFNSIEVSDAVKILRSSDPIGGEELANQQEVEEIQSTVNETKLYQDAETNTQETNSIRSSEYSGDNEELGNRQEVAGNQPTVNQTKLYQDAETNTEETNPTRSSEYSGDNEELGNQQEVEEIQPIVDKIKNEETVTEANFMPLNFTETLNARVIELERCTQVISENFSECSKERLKISKYIRRMQHEVKELEGLFSKGNRDSLNYMDDMVECITNMYDFSKKIILQLNTEVGGCSEDIRKCLEDVTEVLKYINNCSSDKEWLKHPSKMVTVAAGAVHAADDGEADEKEEAKKKEKNLIMLTV